jgi:hypothetical protein
MDLHAPRQDRHDLDRMAMRTPVRVGAGSRKKLDGNGVN